MDECSGTHSEFFILKSNQHLVLASTEAILGLGKVIVSSSFNMHIAGVKHILVNVVHEKQIKRNEKVIMCNSLVLCCLTQCT